MSAKAPSSHTPHIVFKFIVIGPTAVGKSSLLLQFTESYFHAEHETTVGVEFGTYLCEFDGQPVKLQIWDTAGQESFRAITRAYYRGAHGVLLVYDVTRRDSFDFLESWIEESRQNGERFATTLLVGNKCDLENGRHVSYDEGQAFAQQHGLLFLETSAKTALNVEEAFVKLARIVFDKYRKGLLSHALSSNESNQASLVLTSPAKQDNNAQKACCGE